MIFGDGGVGLRSTMVDLHYIPGHFGGGTSALLEQLSSGSGHFRVSRLEDDGDLVWLGGVGDAESRSLSGRAHIAASRPIPVTLETFGAPPSGRRILFGVSLDLPEDLGITHKDVEVGLLGIAYSILTREDQGAVLVGAGLGPVGAGLPRGTVADQVLALLSIHGKSVDLIVTPTDTATSLDQLADFARREQGGLFEYRRL